MFVTRALAATALAGLAFGISAPIAAAADFAPVVVSHSDCGHRGGGNGRGDGDNGRGNDRGDRGNDRGDRGNGRGDGDNGRGNGRGDDNNGRGNDRGDRGNGRGDDNNMGGDNSTSQFNDSAWMGDSHGWGHHCHPSHGADTGLGGSITGMNATQTALGGALLATAVAGGAVYLRRRQGTNV